MRKAIIAFTLFTAIPAYASDFSSKKVFESGRYVFFESPSQANLLLFIGKTDTEVVSKADNATTDGHPIRSWVIKTKWKNDNNALSEDLGKAIEANPEWRSFAKDSQPVSSSYCHFNLHDPEIKVGQGERATSLESTGDLCTFVVHTRDGGDQKLLSAIRRNDLIDNGLGKINLAVASRQHPFLDSAQVSQKIQEILANDQDKKISEKEATFYLGASLANYHADDFVSDPNSLFDASNRQNLLEAVDKLLHSLFIKAADAKTYTFHPIVSITPITVGAYKTLTFDPQAREAQL